MLDEKEKQVYNKTTEITNGGVAMQCEMARQFFDMLTVITAKQKIPKEYIFKVYYIFCMVIPLL